MMFATTAAFAQYPTNGLVAYFPLNGDGNDVGPNSITPTYYAATTVANRFSEADRSVSLASANQEYIEYDMTANSALQLTGDFTIGFWSKMGTGYVADECFLSLGGKVVFSLALPGNGSTRMMYSTTVPSGGGSASQSFGPTIWNHFIITRSGGTVSAYRNNSFAGSSSVGTAAITYDSNPVLRLGRNQAGGGSLNASMDDVFIYNRALDATEIGQVYNSGVCNPITQAVTATGPTTFCAGVPVDYTLSGLPLIS